MTSCLRKVFHNKNIFNQLLLKRNFTNTAYGPTGVLVNRLLPKDSDEYKDLWNKSSELYEINLSARNTCDIELILNGAFSPLNGFMTSKDYNSVVNNMTLNDGTIFPIPINLDITEQQALDIEKERIDEILLRDAEGNPIAILNVEDIWRADKKIESEKVFGGDPEHPSISFLNNTIKNMYIGGKLFGFQLPPHYDYKDLRKTPLETRELFNKNKWNKIVAFQTRNPMHRAHIELTKIALNNDNEMNLLIHPVVGMTKPGDIDHHTRVKCYRSILPFYPKNRTECVVFPLAMRMCGPREALWHMIIRKNFGCTHFIVGRDHAGPGSNSNGKDFYGAFDARDLAVKYQDKIGIKTLAFDMQVYDMESDKYYDDTNFPKGRKKYKLSGTEVRRRLGTGEDIPEWFSYGDVVKILRKAQPPKHKQGFVIFMSGFSGSGKSTVANALQEKLMELQDRRITMLDGDIVRKLISSGLGFSKEDRNTNIKRIGYIASMISNSGGIAIAAPIAPYKESRDFSKDICKQVGGYCEIHISTPIETCEKRDRKGLYEKQKKGILKGLTGVDDTYEIPQNPDLVIDTTNISIENACNIILDWLYKEGYLIKEKEPQPIE